jgi:hypothetical protein
VTQIDDGVNLLPEEQRTIPLCTICRGIRARWDCYSEDDENPGAELVCNPCLPKVRGLGWHVEPLEDIE